MKLFAIVLVLVFLAWSHVVIPEKTVTALKPVKVLSVTGPENNQPSGLTIFNKAGFPVGTPLLIKPIAHSRAQCRCPRFDDNPEPLVCELRRINPSHQTDFIHQIQRGRVWHFNLPAAFTA